MAGKKQKSITEVGPQSYRDLLKLNAEMYSKASASPYANMKLGNYRRATDYIYEGPEQSPIMIQSGGKDYWGNSAFDNDVANETEWENLSDVRANNLSALSKAINGTLKGAILAGTTFVDGTVGMLNGVGQMIANGASDNDKRWYEGIYDNHTTRLMNDLNKLAEEYLPNYRTTMENENPWYSIDNLTSANFIFDTVVKNIGFTVGAAYSGGVYAKAINGIAKAAGLAKNVGMVAETVEAGLKAMQAATKTKYAKAVVGSFFSAYAEATQEAINQKEDFVKTQSASLLNRSAKDKQLALLEFINAGGNILANGTADSLSNPEAYAKLEARYKAIDLALQAAENAINVNANKSSLMTFLLNLAILTVDNFYMFGKLYAGGWNAARNANKNVTRATKEAITRAKEAARAGDLSELKRLEGIVKKAEETGFQGLTETEKLLVEEFTPHLLSTGQRAAVAAVTPVIREGVWEEMALGSAAQASTFKYGDRLDRIYEATLDPHAQREALGTWESIAKGFASQYGDINNWEEAFVGGITGLFGSPTFGRNTNSTDDTYLGRSKWIGMSGGSIADVMGVIRDRRTDREASAAATNVMRDSKLAEGLKHLIAQTRFSSDLRKFLIADDEKEYKDARTAAIFELILAMKRVGRLDLLQKAMKATTEFTDEDINQIFKDTKQEVSVLDSELKQKIKVRDDLEQLITTHQQQELLVKLLSELLNDTQLYDNWVKLKEKLAKDLGNINAEIEAAKAFTQSPYIKKDGTPFTVEEIKADIKKRVDLFDRILQTVTTSYDLIDMATGNALTNEQLNTLTWYKVMMDDWDLRAKGITDKWSSLLENILTDPVLQEELKRFDEIEKLLQEAGVSPEEMRMRYGGLFDNHRNRKEFLSTVSEIQRRLKKGGLEFAYLLSNPLKEEKMDKTAGEALLEFLTKGIVEGNNTITEDAKLSLLKSLKDLAAIGKGHRKYNELLKTYLNNPKQMDVTRALVLSLANQLASRIALNNAMGNINLNSTAGSVANQLKQNARDIENAGGLEALLLNADDPLKEVLEKAKSIIGLIDTLQDEMDNAGIDDSIIKAASLIIDLHLDEVDIPLLILEVLKTGINENELEDILKAAGITDELDLLRKTEAAERALAGFLDANSDRIFLALDRLEKANAAAEAIAENANIPTTFKEEEPELPTHIPEEEIPEVPNIDIDDVPAVPGLIPEIDAPAGPAVQEEVIKDEDVPAPVNPTSSNSAERFNKDSTARATPTPHLGEDGYDNRRLLSQYYLHGKDRMTLAEYYRAHPDLIPPGVDKDEFLRYVELVTLYLTEKGAYTYISGSNPNHKLKKDLPIRFTTDKELNEKVGTTVILMVVEDEQGNQLVIGSLPTALDFKCKLRGRDGRWGNLTLALRCPETLALYDALCAELLAEGAELYSNIVTKVSNIKGGHPSFSAVNRSVSKVFGNTVIPLHIVTKPTDQRLSPAARGKNLMNIPNASPGEVYVYIESATGAMIPLQCISSLLKDLPKDDWYIQETIAAIQALSDELNIGKSKAQLIKKLPFLRENLHINLGQKQDGTQQIVIGWGVNGYDSEGRPKTKYTRTLVLDANGNISEDVAYAFIRNVSGIKIKSSTGKELFPTTSVDLNRLGDEEYVRNISNYLHINVTENSPRTIDDWFTYERPAILEANRRPSPTRPSNPQAPAPHSTTVETPAGIVEISSAGTATHTDPNKTLTEEESNAAVEQALLDSPVDDLGFNIASLSEEMGGLFGSSAIQTDISTGRMVNLNRRRSKKPGKPLLVSDTLDTESSSKELLADLERLAKMFPKLAKEGRIVLVDGLINIVDSKGNPRQAYGLFRNGVLYISNKHPKGTAFHEAFHYITDTLLTENERNVMFEEAAKVFGSMSKLALEEKLAESFREFMNVRLDNSFKGRLRNIFYNLKHMVQALVGRETYLDNLFWSIYKNKYNERKENISEDTFKQELLEYKTLKLKYDNLSKEAREYFNQRGFSLLNYENLSISQKEILLRCM